MTQYDDDKFETLLQHAHHDTALVGYGAEADSIVNVALQCEDCGVVLIDVEPEYRLPEHFRE